MTFRAIALTAVLLGAAVLSYVVLRPDHVGAVAAERADAPVCVSVAQRWPDQVAGRGRVEVRGRPTAVAAWGEPAIIARCGATSPGPTTQDCIAADGIDWVGRRLEDGMAFTSYGRDPAVEVLVPAAYAPEPLVLSAFAEAVREIPQGEHACR